MTADQFRELALSLPGAAEVGHMGHPDFRVNGRIFATLFSPDENWGMVKLPLDEQETICAAHPKIFRPVPGGWGRMGCTNIHLSNANEQIAEHGLRLAWHFIAEKSKALTRAKARK